MSVLQKKKAVTRIPDVYRRLHGAVISESGTMSLIDLWLCCLRRRGRVGEKVMGGLQREGGRRC